MVANHDHRFLSDSDEIRVRHLDGATIGEAQQEWLHAAVNPFADQFDIHEAFIFAQTFGKGKDVCFGG